MTSHHGGTLSSRKSTQIACWNAKTLKKVGGHGITTCTLDDYRVDIARLSKVRLPGSDSQWIKIPGADAICLSYRSGKMINLRLYGVTIALGKKLTMHKLI